RIQPSKGQEAKDTVLVQQQSDKSSGSSGNAGSSLRSQGQKRSGDPLVGSPGQLGKSSFASHGFGCTGGFGFGYGSGFGGGGGGGFGYGRGFGSGRGGGFGYGKGNGFSSGSGNGLGSCKLAPLTQKSVQRELKLSKDQVKKLKTLQGKQQERMLRLGGDPRLDSRFKEPDALVKQLEEL